MTSVHFCLSHNDQNVDDKLELEPSTSTLAEPRRSKNTMALLPAVQSRFEFFLNVSRTNPWDQSGDVLHRSYCLLGLRCFVVDVSRRWYDVIDTTSVIRRRRYDVGDTSSVIRRRWYDVGDTTSKSTFFYDVFCTCQIFFNGLTQATFLFIFIFSKCRT